eukprot:TRINITY_DN12672_c0_g3_i1.p1 TRINITY_DN12672_c0_g3~~TRINITY_DN12672_c0_g3_i1.p1  ORF type:complete len:211 (+),score=26.04 TRINITY_DN12672_c0_g3_i1:75-707(+)
MIVVAKSLAAVLTILWAKLIFDPNSTWRLVTAGEHFDKVVHVYEVGLWQWHEAVFSESEASERAVSPGYFLMTKAGSLHCGAAPSTEANAEENFRRRCFSWTVLQRSSIVVFFVLTSAAILLGASVILQNGFLIHVCLFFAPVMASSSLLYYFTSNVVEFADPDKAQLGSAYFYGILLSLCSWLPFASLLVPDMRGEKVPSKLRSIYGSA